MTEPKIHRFIGPYQLGQGTMRIDDADLARQMRTVLKLAPGEVVIIGDGNGNEAHCRILSYDHNAVLLECMSIGRNAVELPRRTILYCAVLKSDHFELAAAKAAEVGISEIVPVLTARTVKRSLRLDRVEKIVREAAELSGRGLVPQVQPIVEFDRALTLASGNDTNFFFDLSGQQFKGVAGSVRRAGLFIGPEGGWDDREVQGARDAGMKIISLGGLVMRAETAAIVASYLVAHGMKN
jgi:16S rRNA (uracil1498-N3)-methyltransferase